MDISYRSTQATVHNDYKENSSISDQIVSGNMGPLLESKRQRMEWKHPLSLVHIQTVVILQETDAKNLWGYERTYSDSVPGIWGNGEQCNILVLWCKTNWNFQFVTNDKDCYPRVYYCSMTMHSCIKEQQGLYNVLDLNCFPITSLQLESGSLWLWYLWHLEGAATWSQLQLRGWGPANIASWATIKLLLGRKWIRKRNLYFI